MLSAWATKKVYFSCGHQPRSVSEAPKKQPHFSPKNGHLFLPDTGRAAAAGLAMTKRASLCHPSEVVFVQKCRGLYAKMEKWEVFSNHCRVRTYSEDAVFIYVEFRSIRACSSKYRGVPLVRPSSRQNNNINRVKSIRENNYGNRSSNQRQSSQFKEINRASDGGG